MKTSIARLVFFAAISTLFQQEIPLIAQPQPIENFGPIHRATELIGTDVHNTQYQTLGVIRDFGLELKNGLVPYTIFSSGGFFSVGDRLLAVPTTAFQTGGKMLMLKMDREQLKAAPSFDRNNWPDMSDPRWGKQIYSFYKQPFWQTGGISRMSRNAQISEPAGAENRPGATSFERTRNNERAGNLSKDRSPRQGLGADDLTGNDERINRADANLNATRTPSTPYETSLHGFEEFSRTDSGLPRDRSPRQGLGAEDLTSNDVKTSRRFFAQTGVPMNESAGAQTTPSANSQSNWQRANKTSTIPEQKISRATELIGTEVRNPQNERVGEIKDVVIDMNSGRIAYMLLSAGGFLGVGDKLYAVPPMSFSKGADEHTLVLNTDKAALKASPSVEKNNWEAANNEQFTTEVYRYYHQQPYWQRGATLNEPAGASPLPVSTNDIHDPNWDKSYNNNGERKNALPSQDSSGAQKPGAQVNEHSGAEPERNQNNQSSAANQPNSDTGTATKEAAELNSSNIQETNLNSSTIQEPSGTSSGVISTEPIATSENQGSSADRALSQRVRSALSNDTVLSQVAPTLQISAANGRVTLRGSVSSQDEKESIATRAAEIVGGRDKVENQLQVKNHGQNP